MDKIPITFRAVLQRLQRTLAKEDCVLKKARGQMIRSNFGAYYILHRRRNMVHTRYVDPVKLAQERGVLEPWEEVVEEETPAPETPALDAPDFDPHRLRLGSVCGRGHTYRDTGQSLRLLSGGCVECARASQRKRS